MKKHSCQSCLMPFSKDLGPRESEKYCSLCFKNGKFCYTGNSLEEFQSVAKKSMIDNGMNPIKASIFAWSIRFAPRWKR